MIYEEVALGLTVRGVPEEEIRERVHETLKILWIVPVPELAGFCIEFRSEEAGDHCVYSCYEAGDPDLDEPTAGQDYHHYTEIMEIFKGNQRDTWGRPLS